MIIDENNLYPSEGYKYITNGASFSTWVILGKDDSVDNWHDTNGEPPKPPEPVSTELQELADVVDDSEIMANDLIGGMNDV